jgi:hypothetical protein
MKTRSAVALAGLAVAFTASSIAQQKETIDPN